MPIKGNVCEDKLLTFGNIERPKKNGRIYVCPDSVTISPVAPEIGIIIIILCLRILHIHGVKITKFRPP